MPLVSGAAVSQDPGQSRVAAGCTTRVQNSHTSLPAGMHLAVADSLETPGAVHNLPAGTCSARRSGHTGQGTAGAAASQECAKCVRCTPDGGAVVLPGSQSRQHTAAGRLEESETGCLWARNRSDCAWATCLQVLAEQFGTLAGEHIQAVEQIQVAAAPVFATSLADTHPAAGPLTNHAHTGSFLTLGTWPQTATTKLHASGRTEVRLVATLRRRQPGLDIGGEGKSARGRRGLGARRGAVRT